VIVEIKVALEQAAEVALEEARLSCPLHSATSVLVPIFLHGSLILNVLQYLESIPCT